MMSELIRRALGAPARDSAVQSTGLLLLSALLCSLLTACSPPAAPAATAGGFSGMAEVDETHYLFVRDLKSFEDGARLGVLQLNADRRYDIADVAVDDWAHAEGRASDLEAMCAIPGRHGEFLLLESGHWEGGYGRLFRIRLSAADGGYDAVVLHALELPEFDTRGIDDPGDEMEGLACGSKDDGRILVILGERGGSSAYPNGLLRWFTLDPNSNAVAWTEAGRMGIEVDAPGGWRDPRTNRDISALHLAPDGVLWAAAAEDLSDEGPFSSVVYRLGRVWPDAEQPVQLSAELRIRSVLSGVKVEALASGTPAIVNSDFAVGTEDELFGGIWRPIR